MTRPNPLACCRLLAGLLLLGSAAIPVIAGAQATDTAAAADRYFFHPRLVLASAERIHLTAEQREQIQQFFQESQSGFRTLRFELGNAMTRLAAAAVTRPVAEDDILALLDEVLEIERQIKRGQLLMLVRIKNVLTTEQQALLDEIKRQQAQRRQQQERPRP